MERDKDSLSRTKKRRILFRIVLVLVGLVAGFLCIEAGLRVAEILKVPWVFFATEGLVQYQVPDEKLGFRIEPNAPGHDAKGFRNKAVTEQADIVAIGDSQTWGINANIDEAWPQVLTVLSGHSTYNMALGFYNTVDYWALTEEALQLSPKIIIIGLYPGNDLWGAYNRVYSNDTYSWLRTSQMENRLLGDTVLSQSVDVKGEQAEYATWLEQSIFGDLGRELNKRSRALRLLWRSWRIINDSQYKADEAWALAHPDQGVVYEKDGIRSILEPGYRLPALDLDDPCVGEGLRISKEMLLLINSETKRANVQLLVLLIPTKETVYAEAVETLQGELTPTYTELVQMEKRVRSEIISLCTENDIQYVDALPSLTEAIQRGEEIYPHYINGHPLPRGYSVIASTVSKTLNRLTWLE